MEYWLGRPLRTEVEVLYRCWVCADSKDYVYGPEWVVEESEFKNVIEYEEENGDITILIRYNTRSLFSVVEETLN